MNALQCSHNRNGASWSPPMCDLRSLGRTQTAVGVVRDENTVWFSPGRGGLCCSWPIVGCHACRTRPVGRPGEAGQAKLVSHLFLSHPRLPHPWWECWEACGVPLHDAFSWVDFLWPPILTNGHPSTTEDVWNPSPPSRNVNLV